MFFLACKHGFLKVFFENVKGGAANSVKFIGHYLSEALYIRLGQFARPLAPMRCLKIKFVAENSIMIPGKQTQCAIFGRWGRCLHFLTATLAEYGRAGRPSRRRGIVGGWI